ncbi:hypothetical protein BJAS_P4108 [Bathymodiolus japonicus methanotrophic gill symbiont]|uniref:hypothetical protein n=1 Tax=Bathymodiolus japonicus methanotrophic gill symbiont TaxID=113269 RepID=UPI001B62F1CF|nr:hypothetical protein [Bathymodiolus japonicus methanotrophic gill symbiont]GFO73350.1 hypothetical protein BJAS_P4108 [Bathymodiolus japonicus methanotrophic gill symbiont]
MYLQKTLLAIGVTVALTHSVRLQADSCSVGGYSDSSASADSWGGVSLNKTAELLLELEDVEGAIFDPATSQIIFYGKKEFNCQKWIWMISVLQSDPFMVTGIKPLKTLVFQ